MSVAIAAGVGVLVGRRRRHPRRGRRDPQPPDPRLRPRPGPARGGDGVARHRRRHVQWQRGLVFGLLGVVGALGGARLAALVDADLLMALLAGLLLVVSVAMLRRSLADRRRPDDGVPVASARGRVATAVLTVVVASFVGLLTGFFGVGGGFVVVPALLLLMRLDMRLAVGTSLLVIVVNAVLGRLVAGRLSSRARPRTLSLLFALLLLAVAVVTGVQALPALLG